MGKREIVVGLILVVAFLGIISLYSNNNMTGFAVFNSNLENGEFSGTNFNGSCIVLDSALNGNYTSDILDAGDNATWNSLSFDGFNETIYNIYSVDNNADVWESTNNGINWSLIKDDYNGAEGNAADDMVYNGTNLYILNNQDVWVSSDGVSWTKVNDDFNGASGSNGFFLISNNGLYIFDGAQDVYKSIDDGATWNKIADNFNLGNGAITGVGVDSNNNFWAVDNSADIWSSSDGITWTLAKDDYNGAEGNANAGIIIDSSNSLYVVEDDDDVWKSTNNGINFTKVNDDYNNEGQHAVTIFYFNNLLYIIEGDEDVWVSSDGVSWTKNAVNFNAGNSNVVGASYFNQLTNFSFQIRNCSQSDCSDGNWQTKDLNSLDLQGRYFQYKIILTSSSISASSCINSVSVDYDLVQLNSAPTINLISPQIGSYNLGIISLNFSSSDADNNIDECWYNLNSSENVSLVDCANTTLNLGLGNYTLRMYVNDSENLVASSDVSFNMINNETNTTDNNMTENETNSAPTINLILPVEGLSNNNSLVLEFNASDSDNNLDKCWYKINNDAIVIINCNDNKVFSVTSNGNYTLYVYANDTLGEQAEDFVNFSVIVSAIITTDNSSSNSSSSSSGSESGSVRIFRNISFNRSIGSVNNSNISNTTAEIEQINLSLKSAEQIDNKIVFNYNILSNVNKSVAVNYWISDKNGNNILNGTDNFNLIKGDNSKESSINLPDGVVGEYLFNIEISSADEVIKQVVLLGEQRGFIGNVVSNILDDKTLSVILIVAFIFIVTMIILGRRAKKIPEGVVKKGYVKRI